MQKQTDACHAIAVSFHADECVHNLCITYYIDGTWQLQIHDGKWIDRAKGENRVLGGVRGEGIGFCLLYFAADREEAAA